MTAKTPTKPKTRARAKPKTSPLPLVTAQQIRETCRLTYHDANCVVGAECVNRMSHSFAAEHYLGWVPIADAMVALLIADLKGTTGA